MSASNESTFDDGRCGRVPVEHLHAERRGLFEKMMIEHMTRNHHAVIRNCITTWPSDRRAGKVRSLATAMFTVGLIRETNEVDAMGVRRQINMQISERSDCTWGQQAAARLRRTSQTLHDGDSSPSTRQSYRSRRACRPSTNDEYVSRRCGHALLAGRRARNRLGPNGYHRVVELVDGEQRGFATLERRIDR